VAELVPTTMATESRAVEGHPSNVLTQESGQSRLLVRGSRGRGGFANLLLGSITDYCSHHAKCPVVVVRGAYPEPPSPGC
jgi:nucleotide-binding universal stress UspA family protein